MVILLCSPCESGGSSDVTTERESIICVEMIKSIFNQNQNLSLNTKTGIYLKVKDEQWPATDASTKDNQIHREHMVYTGYFQYYS